MLKKTVFFMVGTGLILGIAATGCANAESKSAEQGKVACTHKTGQVDPHWQIAVMTYTFNRFTLFEAIEKAHQCGAGAIETFAWQKISDKHGDMKLDANMPDSAIKELKAKLKANKVKLVGYYVAVLGKNGQADRQMFEFCKKLGVEYVVSEPDKKTLPAVDALAQEFKIKVAIHNHPRKKKVIDYANWHPDDVMLMLDGRSEWMGCCADTGHWVRSRLDPVKCIQKYKGRLVSLHLKDVNEIGSEGRDMPYGTGIGNLKDVLAEVKKMGYSGTFAIEYESKPMDNMKDVTDCIKWFEKTKKELGVK